MITVEIQGVGPINVHWYSLDGDPHRWFHWYDPTDGHIHHGSKRHYDRVPDGCHGIDPVLLTTTSSTTRPRAVTVKEFKREGKRTIRPGQMVVCQPNQRPRSRKATGQVTAVYEDGSVTVTLAGDQVTIDHQWVHVPLQGRRQVAA
jgi:hypothetical protein